MTSKPTDDDREEAPSANGGNAPSISGIDGLSLDEYGNRTVRLSLGPIEVHVYHDYPLHPWRSPLWIGGRLGSRSFGQMLSPESRLRPFSGGRR